MNSAGYSVPLDIDLSATLKALDVFDKRLGVQEATLKRMGRSDPFSNFNGSLNNFNQKLSDGTRIYQSIEKSAKAYRDELARLTKGETELINKALQAQNSLEYDKVQRSLVATRQRITEIKDGLASLDTTAKKSGGAISSIGNFLKSGVGLVAGFFAVDKLISAEEKLIDIQGEYEKYSAVLTNAFQSERLAAQGLQLISDLAVDTPFQINELTESYVKLVNRGFVPTREEIIKQGDLAATTAKSFDQLSEAILDAVTGEYERLKEFGIRAATVGDNVTLSFKGIEKQVKKTDQEAIRQAILSFGEMKGVVGAMATISQTLNGKISNMSDNFDQLFKNLGEKQTGILYNVVGLFSQLIGYLREITAVPVEEKLRKEQDAFNGLAGSILLTNENSAERKVLLNELLQKYPSLIGFINDETISNRGLSDVMAVVNEQYETRIKLAALDVIARRNSEKIADAITKERDALKGTVEAYTEYQKSLGKTDDQVKEAVKNFRDLDERQKAATINKVVSRNQKLFDQAATSAPAGIEGLGGAAPLSDEQVTFGRRIAALKNLKTAGQEYNQALQDQKDNTTDIVTLQVEEQRNLDKRVASAKEELALLSKRKNLTAEEIERQKFLVSYIKTVPTLNQPPKNTISAPKTGVSKDQARLADELKKLLKQQVDDQEKYEAQIQKIELESDNVRLSQLNKFSEEYLVAKKAYDQKVLDEERKSQVAIYAESIKNVVKFKDSAGKIQQELRSLLDETTAKFRAQGQTAGQARDSAISEIDKTKFSTDPKTKPVRDLLDLRSDVNDKNQAEDNRTRLAVLQKERTDLLGTGFDKEKALISAKYKELYETYKANENLIAELRKKEALELEQSALSSEQKAIDKRTQNVKTLADLAKQQSGETESDFQRRKQEELLKIDRDYYKESLAALEHYLASEVYLRSIADGKVSKEEKEANDQQLALLKAQLDSSTDELDKFTKTNGKLADKYANLWEVFADKTTDAFGKDSGIAKFFNDPANKVAAGKFYDALKNAAESYFEEEIKLSQARIAALDTEVNEKQTLVDAENEKRKEGLANNYQTLKADLDQTKQAREDEKEHLKKVQKEKAIVDSLEIASTTAVAAANLIAAISKTIEGASSIPIAGVFLGLALAATLLGGFVAIKGKLKGATQLRKGKRLDGPSHERGGMNIVNNETGEVDYEAEGREWLIGAKPSEKHDEFLGHLNADTFKDLPIAKQARMLEKLGVRFSKLESNLSRSKQLSIQHNEIQQKADNAALERLLDRVAGHTARIPELERVPLADGRVALYKKGVHVGYDEHRTDK